MGQTDKQFNGFLRMVIRDLKEGLAEDDPAKLREKIEILLVDRKSVV